jgi:transposase
MSAGSGMGDSLGQQDIGPDRDGDRVLREAARAWAWAPNRILCRRFGVEPHIHKRRQPSGSGLGGRRWPVERSNAWLLENKRLALRYDRLGFIVQSLLQAACLFLVVGRLVREF